MAIEFNCPHCQHQYKLKDELGGKTATCKSCRQKITIPLPVTIPDGAVAMDAAAAEALALAALSDEPAKVEQEAANKLIPVECQYCNHKWTEPITRAGKNALCPECKQRIKIPEPKDEGQYDWRQTKTKGPSLAKDKIQKIEGVQDAADAKIVSGTALKEAGAIEEEFEPRPLKQKVMFVMLALGLVAGLFFGGRYLLRDRTAGKEDRLMRDALDEFAQSTEGLPKDEVPVYAGLLHTAAAEHAVRHDAKDKFKEAMDQLGKARAALRPAGGPARNAAVAELAVTTLVMGGPEEQARDQIRLRWMPDPSLRLRPNERVFTVFEELNQTLDLVQTADPEFRNHLVRRLARELIRRGQAAMALELLPRALFAQPEQPEARAVVALEIFRADRNSPLPRQEADKLARMEPELKKGTPPASVQTLFLVLKTDKAPTVVSPPSGSLLDSTRYAYTGFHLLEDRADEALKLAQTPGKPEAQLRCLTLYADWAADPGPALDAAMAVVMSNKDKKDVSLSQAAIHRLAQIAAEKGKHEQAKEFAAKLTDEGLKAWARGDTIRLRLAGAKEKGDEAWSDLPDDARKIRAGHAWGRLVIARHNASLSGDRTAEARAVNGWPTPLGTFGKAGVALGLQDRDK